MKKTKLLSDEEVLQRIYKLADTYDNLDRKKAEYEFENRFTVWECLGFKGYKNKKRKK